MTYIIKNIKEELYKHPFNAGLSLTTAFLSLLLGCWALFF